MSMQVLVMYYSKTGNTKKLAQEIARGVRDVGDVRCVRWITCVFRDDGG